MRTWKIVLLTVSINLLVLLGLVALAWGTGALAQPAGPAHNPAPDATWSNVPKQMNYQGLLLDNEGKPITGTHDLLFTLYYYQLMPLPPKWNAVYSETHRVTLDQGLFNVVLGQDTPLDPGIFDGETALGGSLKVGVAVDGGEELAPAAPLLTSPYAFRSQFTNYMPLSEYTSGWQDAAGASSVTYEHNLGGNPDDYVVSLECDSDATVGVYECGGFSGHAHWSNLTDTDITIFYEAGTDRIRVRIWRTE